MPYFMLLYFNNIFEMHLGEECKNDANTSRNRNKIDYFSIVVYILPKEAQFINNNIHHAILLLTGFLLYAYVLIIFYKWWY